MLITAVLGITASVATELVKALERRLTGTFAEGNAALFLSVVFALFAGLFRLLLIDVPFEYIWSIESLLALSAQAFGFSQLYFKTIAKWFGLTVQ